MSPGFLIASSLIVACFCLLAGCTEGPAGIATTGPTPASPPSPNGASSTYPVPECYPHPGPSPECPPPPPGRGLRIEIDAEAEWTVHVPVPTCIATEDVLGKLEDAGLHDAVWVTFPNGTAIRVNGTGSADVGLPFHGSGSCGQREPWTTDHMDWERLAVPPGDGAETVTIQFVHSVGYCQSMTKAEGQPSPERWTSFAFSSFDICS